MKRKIAAILAADIAGYSKLVAEDEEETLRRLASYRAVFDDFIKRHDGRIFNTAGDAVLAEFPSAVDAVRCAIDVQESLRTRNLAYPASRHMDFRMGITIGDVVERESDLLGDGVNIAARLESLASPGGICVSRAVHEQVASKISVPFADIGEQQVKNIPTPVHAFTLSLRGEPVATTADRRGALSARWSARHILPPLAALLLGVAGAYGLLAMRGTPAPVPAVEAPAAPRAAAAVPVPFVAEQVPMVSANMRNLIRNSYVPAREHKALAISLIRFGIASEQANEEAARMAALDACTKATKPLRSDLECTVYAVGDRIVDPRGRPPMPPQPWLLRDSVVETPYLMERIPLIARTDMGRAMARYHAGKAPRALAVSANGAIGYFVDQPNLEEAVRRSLEHCGYRAGVPCRIVAVDDVFVVPIPTAMRATGYLQTHANSLIAPELRETAARRLTGAGLGWSGLAVGASGRIGIAVQAPNEQAAMEQATADCARQDRGCRVIALGPFAVEPM